MEMCFAICWTDGRDCENVREGLLTPHCRDGRDKPCLAWFIGPTLGH